jgi:hypothetical protein
VEHEALVSCCEVESGVVEAQSKLLIQLINDAPQLPVQDHACPGANMVLNRLKLSIEK